MRVRIATAVVAGVAAVWLTACFDGQSWSKYASAEDRFEAEFPGKVEKEQTAIAANLRPSGLVRSNFYSHMADDRFFLVFTALYEAGTVNLSRGAETLLATYKCRSTTAGKPLSYAGGAAREIVGSECFGIGAEVVSRWFETGPWFHGAVVMIVPTAANRALAQRFLDSFKVTATAL